MKKNLFTLANQITIFRIVLIPVIVILLIQHVTTWAAGLLAFSVLTDLLDGLAARLRKERTAIGAFLDPLADKLLLTSVYLTLAYLGLIDMWLFVIVFSRDLLIVLGWGVIYILTSSSNITPRWLGKGTTAVQMAAALAFITPVPPEIQSFLIWGIVLMTVASVVDYIIVAEKRLGQWSL